MRQRARGQRQARGRSAPAAAERERAGESPAPRRPLLRCGGTLSLCVLSFSNRNVWTLVRAHSAAEMYIELGYRRSKRAITEKSDLLKVTCTASVTSRYICTKLMLWHARIGTDIVSDPFRSIFDGEVGFRSGSSVHQIEQNHLTS